MSVLRLASDLLQRSVLAKRAGLTFGGDRDLFEALGYREELGPDDFRSRYLRGDIASRIVEAYPKSTWRGGAELIEDEDPAIETEFETAWTAFADRLHVWSVLTRADILAGLGPYAVVLLGAEGDLEAELPRLNGSEGVLYLTPYGPDEVKVDSTVDVSEDPRFGLPEMYTINRTSDSGKASHRVHWTRILHVASGVLDDRVNGIPLLQRVWNRLDDLDKVAGGGSEAFWLRVHGGLALSIDKDLKVDTATLTKFKEEAEEFSHQMRRVLAARGFEIERLGGDVSNFGNQVSSLVSLIAGATGIPQRLLLGSERGELASGQDKVNWDERVQDRREEFAEPLIRQLVQRLVDHGALPEVENFDVRWPEIEDLDDRGKADVADKWSKLNSQAGGTVVKAEEIRDQILRLDPLPEEELEEVEGGIEIVAAEGKVRPRRRRGGKRFAR